MHQDAQKKEVNPLMIQSYFDGETPSDELDAISHESLSETPTWQALNELRQAVRLDAESFIDSVDSYALLSSIEDLYTPVAPRQHHKRQSAFRSSTGFRRLSASPPCCAVSLGSCSSSTTTTPHHQPSSTSPTQARPKSNALLRKPHHKAFTPTT